MTLYSYQAADKVIDQYIALGGDVYQTWEGSLGVGNWILTAPGYKTCIIREKYLNEWSSGQTIRFYNVMPKKYEKELEDYLNNEKE